MQVKKQQIYAIFVINIFVGHKTFASSLVSAFPIGSAKTSVCFVLINPSKLTPQPAVPL